MDPGLVLGPKSVDPATGIHRTRRTGGARQELSERVTFTIAGAEEIPGWSLNISRGGLRAIVEEPLRLDHVYQVVVGELAARPGRVVWVQPQPDGAIVGVSFVDIGDPSTSAG